MKRIDLVLPMKSDKTDTTFSKNPLASKIYWIKHSLIIGCQIKGYYRNRICNIFISKREQIHPLQLFNNAIKTTSL